MKTYITLFLWSIFIANAQSAIASDAIYCPAGQVKHIQSQNNNVIIYIDDLGWKAIGNYSSPSTQTRLSLALYAQASGDNLLLAFPLNSGVICSESNYHIEPIKVRLSKKK